jgi:diadenosine tetraphosphate (Ap4A) HIT family hydrolase
LFVVLFWQSRRVRTELVDRRDTLWARSDADPTARETRGIPPSPRIPFDVARYADQVRADSTDGKCFICSIVARERDDHLVIYRDDVCIVFLNRFPTLLGYSLLAPIEHRTDVVTDFTEDEYVDLQRRVHRFGTVLSNVVPTERLYVLSLGSHHGNSHVHWHLAPLPPDVPYEEQQYAALMHENGYLDVSLDEQLALAQRIAEQLAHDP